MKKYAVVPTETIVDVVCDVCKKSCKTQLGDYEHATLAAVWGYASRKDGESYRADLCEDCFDNIVAFIESAEQKTADNHN